MNTGARVATAVAAGYLLGRTKKLKLAIAVGTMLAGKKLAGDSEGLLKQGVAALESTPELARLSEQVRTKLFEALRAAAIATASSRLDALSDALHERSEQIRVTPTPVAEEEEEPEEEAAEEPEAEEEPEEEPEAEEEPEEEPEAEEEPEEEPAARRRPRRRREEDTEREGRRAKKAAPRKKQAAKKAAPAKRAAAKKSAPAKRAAKKTTSSRSQSARRG